MTHRENYLDLDPNYTDQWGRPPMRMTFNFTENDRRLSDHITPIPRSPLEHRVGNPQ